MTRSFNDALNGDFTGPAEQAPAELLKELALSLRRKVKYKINFVVESTAGGGRVIHTLRAEVNQIDYILDLLSVSHEVLKLYPARITGLLSPTLEVQSESELFEKLVEVFNSTKAEETLGTLLKQA